LSSGTLINLLLRWSTHLAYVLSSKHGQPLAPIKAGDLGQAAVDDVADSLNGEGGLRHIGAHNDLAAAPKPGGGEDRGEVQACVASKYLLQGAERKRKGLVCLSLQIVLGTQSPLHTLRLQHNTTVVALKGLVCKADRVPT
jgi:hypothetical protein